MCVRLRIHGSGQSFQVGKETVMDKDIVLYQKNSDGNVSYCCNDYLNIGNMGNIKTKSLRDILNDFGYQKLLDEIKSKVYSHKLCEVCRCVENP